MDLMLLERRVASLPLFARLGMLIEDSSVARIRSWQDWNGPEECLGIAIHERQQTIHDARVHAGEEAEWEQGLALVVDLASRQVPYEPDNDTWHGPNMAVWHAAWSFSLEAVHISKNLPLPLEVQAQIYWFEKGHWPCSLRSLESMDKIDDYVVF